MVFRDASSKWDQWLPALWVVATILLAPSFPAFGQETVERILGDPPESAIPASVDVYKGREVAQTMHYLGADWLIRNEREREEQCSLMLANLGITTGMTVCDIGCGNGFYTLPMAKFVGEDGHVMAVDVQPEMLVMLRERADAYGLTNVSPILGSFHAPRLPPRSLDLVLLVDVYHEFSHPEEMLRAIRHSLKEDGVAVLLEYRSEDPEVPIRRLHKMSKEQIMEEWLPNGFKLVREFDGLPWQHMMFFGRDEAWEPPNAD